MRVMKKVFGHYVGLFFSNFSINFSKMYNFFTTMNIKTKLILNNLRNE